MEKLLRTLTPLTGLLLLLPITICGQFEQKATLYEGRGSRGQYVNFVQAYSPNLRDQNFDNRAQSVCVIGTWLFYDTPNYNSGTKASMEYIFGPSGYCADFKTLSAKSSSVRFAGSPGDYRAETLTFYEGPYFQGPEEYTPCDLPKVSRTNMASLIVTGPSPWTVYDQANFKGESLCIFPPRNDDYLPAFVTDIKAIGAPYNTIRSARKGCWGTPKKYSEGPSVSTSFGSSQKKGANLFLAVGNKFPFSPAVVGNAKDN